MRRGIFMLAIAMSAALAGYVGVSRPLVGAAIFGSSVVMLIFMREPVLIGLLSVLTTLSLVRIAGGVVSLAEVLTVMAAALAAVDLSKRDLPRSFTRSLGAAFAYVGVMAALVILHPSVPASAQWAHRLTIVVGGLLVGAWLAVNKRFNLTITLLCAGVLVLALEAMRVFIATDFQPAFPFGYHKNFVGSLSAGMILVIGLAPSTFLAPTRVRYAALAVLFGGLFASQSRGAAIALCVGLLTWVTFRRVRGRDRKVGAAILLAGAAVAFAVASAIQQVQLRDAHSSLAARQKVGEVTMELWASSPITGVGLAYFRDPDFASVTLNFGSVNVLQEALAEGGVISLASLLALIFVLCYSLTRQPSELAAAALALLVGRLAHGMIDVFWTAASTTIVFIVVGAALVTAGASEDPAILADENDESLDSGIPDTSGTSDPRDPAATDTAALTDARGQIPAPGQLAVPSRQIARLSEPIRRPPIAG